LVGQSFELITRINRKGVTISLVEQNAVARPQVAHRAYVDAPRVQPVYLGL
jgi:ABC-type branched-subunit amino acid transport system ATPase component